MISHLTIIPVEGLPEVRHRDDVGSMIAGATRLQDGDVLVVAQKVISKAEGAVAAPRADETSEAARRRIARETAAAVVADAPWVLIVRTKEGFVCANAGIDASNVPDGALTLLPDDADASARRLRSAFAEQGVDVAVIVADTFGRPWRVGQTDVAIGIAGMAPLRDERGAMDRHGNLLSVTEVAVADELAAAADLVRDKAAGVPAVVVRGLTFAPAEDVSARDLVRDPATDLFRRGAGMLAAALAAPWPAGPMTGATDAELAQARRVAPTLVVTAPGPPTVAEADTFEAGLAAAVLVDVGLAVRWRTTATRVILEIGRSQLRR